MKSVKLAVLMCGLALSMWIVGIAVTSVPVSASGNLQVGARPPLRDISTLACGSYYGSYTCKTNCQLSYQSGCPTQQARYDVTFKTVQVYQNGRRVTGGTFGYVCGSCSADCPNSTC